MRLATLLGCLVSLTPFTALAQPGFLKDAIDSATGGAERRNDLEGGIWEYKVVQRTGQKKTVLQGKVRIRDEAAFDVAGSAKGDLLNEAGIEAPDEGGSFPFGIKPPTNLGVLDRVAEGNRGGDRIADITYKRARNSTTATPKVTFRFDTDDEHPLSGEALVKYDTRNGGGVWRGSYYAVQPDGKKKRWNFELRFIED
ncbi:hypothetical protein MalM25_34040 [Planctomycetes bacterium MalM25]|nr:hypothetical protein MalM25_34040 [Planctomycetes bacterium MalM25]